MTQEQFTSWLRTTAGAIGGSLVTLAATKGVSIPDVFTGPQAIAFYGGLVTFVAPIIWGWFAHTPLAIVQSAAARPEVASVAIKPTAANGLAQAAADSTQPKIVQQN